jgi:hypothetical protein
MKKTVLIFAMLWLAASASAQFVLDARTKSILDLYYLKKAPGMVTTTNILDGTILLQDLNASTIAALSGSSSAIRETGIWGIQRDGSIALLPMFLTWRAGLWETTNGLTVTLASAGGLDALWTTNGSGNIALRTP